MTMGELLEAGMLGCFSIGWYWSIFTMLRTRQPSGKSAPFVLFTVTGYVFGLAAKFAHFQTDGVLCPVTIVYVWNLAITALDLTLVLYFSRPRPHPGAVAREGSDLAPLSA